MELTTTEKPLPFDAAAEADASREKRLVERVQAGDISAFTGLMQTHVRPLRAYLALRVPARQLVDDLAQETFVIAHQKIAKFKAGTCFAAWLRGIAWQLLRREKKRYRLDEANREKLVDHVSLRNAPAAASDRRVEALESCLAKLPENLRELVGLKYTKGMSSGEMASALDRTEEWVRVTLYRTREKLRACIEMSKS